MTIVELVDQNGGFNFVRDTLNMCRWQVKAPWREKTNYRLYVPKKSVTDVMGYQNDSTVVEFATYDPEKFATVTLNVTGEEGKEYILLLTDSSNKTLQELTGVTTGQYRFNFVAPGDVRLRVIEDSNCNGQWDAGDVLQRLQPERAEIYANDRGEETFTTKMNWDFEINLDMAKLFKPMTMEEFFRLWITLAGSSCISTTSSALATSTPSGRSEIPCFCMTARISSPRPTSIIWAL